jgi:hypothetical protein
MSAYDNTKALFDSLNKMFPPSPLNSTDMNFGPSQPEHRDEGPELDRNEREGGIADAIGFYTDGKHLSDECEADHHEDCDDWHTCACECHQSEADMQRIYDSRAFNS